MFPLAVMTARGVWAGSVRCNGLFGTVGAAGTVIGCAVGGIADVAVGWGFASLVRVSQGLAPGALGEGGARVAVLNAEALTEEPDRGFGEEALGDVAFGVLE